MTLQEVQRRPVLTGIGADEGAAIARGRYRVIFGVGRGQGQGQGHLVARGRESRPILTPIVRPQPTTICSQRKESRWPIPI